VPGAGRQGVAHHALVQRRLGGPSRRRRDR
jgi:hypothetical protein